MSRCSQELFATDCQHLEAYWGNDKLHDTFGIPLETSVIATSSASLSGARCRAVGAGIVVDWQ